MMILPSFLEKEFKFYNHKTIKISSLRVGLLRINSSVNYVPIYKTPHYFFVRHYLFNEKSTPIFGYKNYRHYFKLNSHCCCSENEFIQLINDVYLNGYDWQKRPILVWRSWKCPISLNRWNVADGFHRLAILAGLGKNEALVATLRKRRSFCERISYKIFGYNEQKRKKFNVIF